MKKRIENRYPNIDTFGSRLIYLYDNAGLLVNGAIDFSRVANDLYSMGFREYSYNADNKTIHNQTKNTADTLRKHILKSSADTIGGTWLNIYCKYFKCSCDFLMGYISLPLHTNTDISKVLGLDNKAIDTLKSLARNNAAELPKTSAEIVAYYGSLCTDNDYQNRLAALNRILNNISDSDILTFIYLYLHQSDSDNNYLSDDKTGMIYNANILYQSALKDNIFLELQKLKQ